MKVSVSMASLDLLATEFAKRRDLVLRDYKALRSLLNDCLHDERAKANQLWAAVECGILKSILQEIAPDAFFAQRMVSLLEIEYGYPQYLCEWVVGVWMALVQGIELPAFTGNAQLAQSKEAIQFMDIAHELQGLQLPYYLSLPQNNFIVVGSGTMNALHIKRANDIDIIVPRSFFNVIADFEGEEDGWRCMEDENNEDYAKLLRRTKRGCPKIEILGENLKFDPKSFEAKLAESFVMNGIRYMPLIEVYRIKKLLGRNKDVLDISLIERYMRLHNEEFWQCDSCGEWYSHNLDAVKSIRSEDGLALCELHKLSDPKSHVPMSNLRVLLFPKLYSSQYNGIWESKFILQEKN